MKPPEEVAREIVQKYYNTEFDGQHQAAHALAGYITAALTTERQRLKDAEKWMRHLDGCAFGSRIAYNSMTKSFCTCGLDVFRKEK